MPYEGNGSDGRHYWLTPPSLMRELQEEFGFDFDACPYPRPEDFDGLEAEWGASTYVNPPFKGPTAWVKKAIAESEQGKTVVFVFPIDKWIHKLLAAGAEVRNLGDVKWCATEDGQPGKGMGRHIAAFILRPHPTGYTPAPAARGEGGRDQPCGLPTVYPVEGHGGPCDPNTGIAVYPDGRRMFVRLASEPLRWGEEPTAARSEPSAEGQAATLSPSLSRALRTIRANGGVVKMRRISGHDSPWYYMAGDAIVEYNDVLGLELNGALSRRPGPPGCERAEFHAVGGV